VSTNPSPKDSSSPRSLRSPRLTVRLVQFARYYCDPSSPAYGNKAKAAELVPYAGRPGSNQLAVQGHRAYKRLQQHAGLVKLLVDTDCTLERAFRCISDAMGAEIRTVVTAGGAASVVAVGPNHPVRLKAAP